MNLLPFHTYENSFVGNISRSPFEMRCNLSPPMSVNTHKCLRKTFGYKELCLSISHHASGWRSAHFKILRNLSWVATSKSTGFDSATRSYNSCGQNFIAPFSKSSMVFRFTCRIRLFYQKQLSESRETSDFLLYGEGRYLRPIIQKLELVITIICCCRHSSSCWIATATTSSTLILVPSSMIIKLSCGRSFFIRPVASSYRPPVLRASGTK